MDNRRKLGLIHAREATKPRKGWSGEHLLVTTQNVRNDKEAYRNTATVIGAAKHHINFWPINLGW